VVDSKALCVTWQTKSQNIYFECEKGKEVTKWIISHFNQDVHASLKAYSLEGKATEAEPRVAELISDMQLSPKLQQSNEDCEEIATENGDVMKENADISSVEHREKNDGAIASARCINSSSQDVIVNEPPVALRIEVSEIKFKLNQHVHETRTEFQQIKELV
jgi:ferritin-like metal-binding protein YciE